MYYVEVNRGEGWTLVGQYANREQAAKIVADYRRNGVKVRIVTES